MRRTMEAVRARILLVEDPFISKYLDGLLGGLGYSVTLAGVHQAAAAIRKDEAAFAALVTNTPGEFLEFAGRMALLYLAAIPDEELASRFQACRVIAKPFRARYFLDAVEELLQTRGRELPQGSRAAAADSTSPRL